MKQNLSVHGHNTRSKLSFHVEFCIRVLFQKSVVNSTIERLGEFKYWEQL